MLRSARSARLEASPSFETRSGACHRAAQSADPSGPLLRIRSERAARPSMQLRRLEEAGAVAGFDPRLDGLAVAVDRHRDFKAGRTERPYLAIEPGEIADLGAGDRKQHVAGAQIRFLRR